MRSRAFHALAFVMFLSSLLATNASAADSACADTIESDDGSITGSLIGEESHSSFLMPWPTFQFLITVETATGYYKLSDGSVIAVSCVSMTV